MTTFEQALQAAVQHEGFKKVKRLKKVPLYQAPDGQRYRLADAVVAVVRCDGQEK